ncbi:MAG: cytochrome c3 family protein [Chloroflexota bacterium]
MRSKLIIVGALLLLLALGLAACQSQTPPPATEKPCPTAAPCPECPTCPTPPPPPEPVVKDVPFQDLWAASPHNDGEAEAFNHWNEDDPAEVPTSCATCHSTAGYQDFLGADGSEAGKVDQAVPAPAGTVQCVACHNAATATLDKVTFPSGLEVTGVGPTARCMVCHQGRESKVSVDKRLADYNATDLDAVPAPIKNDAGNDVPLGFLNIHYYAAGATLYGTQAKGGYEYDGKVYDGKFRHVEGIDSCTGCHDSHSLEVKLETCQECHEGATSLEELKKTRMLGSLADYDGDGDTKEPIADELAGVQEILYAAIQEYAKTVAGAGITYDAAAYPYFFVDADGDGAADKDDKDASIRYSAWTPRLLKAAYNYQTVTKDPGAFAHNAKYMIQLMYDSLEDLNAKLGTIDMSKMHRDDPGHFAGATEAFRHWDEDGEVEAGCAKCHSATGLPQFIEYGANIGNEISNGFMCSTCHNEADWPNRYSVAEVTFPSGAKVTFGGTDADGKPVANDANLCLMCHQGRSSGPTVNRALAGKDPETPDPAIRFLNVHYFAAGATLFGADTQGAYEFEGKEYVGKHPHVEASFTCASCHDVHALEIKVENCAGCHAAAADPKDPATYNMSGTDWDGDGTAEPVKDEIAGFGERLYAAMQAYAEAKGAPIEYKAASYPYFFGADGSGYASWTPTLLKAAYNYQYWQKDPGAFAHNAKYVMQFLYDSIEAVGGDTTGLTRP